MGKKEGQSPASESPSSWDRPSEERERSQWEFFSRLTAWIIVHTGMKWNDVLDLSPLRIAFIAKAVERRRTLDKLSIFDAQASLIDEKSLSRLNSELRESNWD